MIEENKKVEKESAAHEANAYSDLFDFFEREHNLNLLHSEMDDIIHAVDKFKKEFNFEEERTLK